MLINTQKMTNNTTLLSPQHNFNKY